MIDTSDSDHVEEIYGLLNLGLQGFAFFCENLCQKPTCFRRFGAVDDHVAIWKQFFVATMFITRPHRKYKLTAENMFFPYGF